MSDGRPVARLLSPVIVGVLVLTLLMAVCGIVGVYLSTRSVNMISGQLEPAARADLEIRQNLSDMSLAVRGWARSGDPRFIEDYRAAQGRMSKPQRVLADFAAGDEELSALVARERQAAEAWVDGFATPRLSRPGGPRTFDPDRFDEGLALFDDYRAAHGRTLAALDARLGAAAEDASNRLRATTLAILLITVIEGWVILRARRRLTVQLADPLHELERVVQQMAGSNPDVRATSLGPREVRAVAASLNTLADAQARARAVEARIARDQRNLDAAKDDFVSNVSHELRTPLTTISGYLEMISDEFRDGLRPHHERMLDASRRNVDRLQMIIDDLLTLSRTEASTTDLTQVELAPLLQDVVTDIRMTASRRRIDVRLQVSPEPVLVLGERVMLYRAFLNTLSNAVKFSPDGASVEVSLAADGEVATVQIRDHGIGIPAEELDQLGTRFFRASNATRNDIGGTGLGVRIVQTILDKHAGRLEIESELGSGTTVRMLLPQQALRTPVPTTTAAGVGEGPGTD